MLSMPAAEDNFMFAILLASPSKCRITGYIGKHSQAGKTGGQDITDVENDLANTSFKKKTQLTNLLTFSVRKGDAKTGGGVNNVLKFTRIV